MNTTNKSQNPPFKNAVQGPSLPFQNKIFGVSVIPIFTVFLVIKQ